MRSESESPVYRRVLVKVSGEALAGDRAFGIDHDMLLAISREIRSVVALGVSVGIVIGGGNLFRGVSADKMDRINADYIGMLATMMNALALQGAFAREQIEARVQSALDIPSVIEPYVREHALSYLDQLYTVIFAGGTGNPLFTTDSAASLRAIEIKADLMLKATKVDGVFDKDPVANPNAVKFEQISYDDVLGRHLGVMDATAVILCREHSMPIRVFDISVTGSLRRIVCGENLGTLINNVKACSGRDSIDVAPT